MFLFCFVEKLWLYLRYIYLQLEIQNDNDHYLSTSLSGTDEHPKVDANGNCESGDKVSIPLLFFLNTFLNIGVTIQNTEDQPFFYIFPLQINPNYLGETQLASFTVTSPEQRHLLQNGEASSDHSQCSNNTETLTRTDGCSSLESIGPLQSTLALHDPHSALSEPRSLHSNIEPFTPQPSIPIQYSSQPSSQPTSPQVISPVTTSPHVNVNITFHIANGSCGTPTSITPTDLRQVDSKLPFGEEEETFSIPQQEAGKQSLMSVQESESYSAWRVTYVKDWW